MSFASAPEMRDVLAVPWSGLRAASLFAGCGGSSIGYRSAGFRLVYGNEWDGLASETYELNLGTPVDRRDVRSVSGGDVLEAVKEDGGAELDVLDGSPPCQPFSAAGRRRGPADPRDMFPEFVRLVREVQPQAFVCENVEGLAKGGATAYFARVHAKLEDAGYAVQAQILDASRYGVPQTRKRVLIMGFRNDLGLRPSLGFPKPALRRAVIRDALPGAARIVRPGRRTRTSANLHYRERRTWLAEEPGPTVTTVGFSGGVDSVPREWVRVQEDGRLRPATSEDALALSAFPGGFRFPARAGEAARWRMLGNAVPPPMARAWAERLRDALLEADTGPDEVAS